MYFTVQPQQTETVSSAPATPDRSRGRTIIMLYLSVFIILLAFFIVLYALSQNEPKQAQSVMSSVSRHFQDPTKGRGSVAGLTGPSLRVPDPGLGGDAEATRLYLPGMRTTSRAVDRTISQSPYQTQLADAIAVAVPSATVVMLADDVLEARMRADALFFSENARIRPGREELVDRLVALLASPPSGLVYEMEFRVGTDYDSTKSLLGDMVGAVQSSAQDGGAVPEGEADLRQVSRARMSLALARAGTFARLTIGRGASPQTVAVGVDPGLPEEIRLVFRLRAAGL